MTVLELPITQPVILAKDAILAAASATSSDEHQTVSSSCNEQKHKLVALLDKVLPLSDFVCRVAQQYPHQIHISFRAIILKTQQPPVDRYSDLLNQEIEQCTNEHQLHQRLRMFRQVEMAKIAIYDLLHLHDIQRSMQSVSFLADAIIQHAYLWIYQQHCSRYGKPEEQQHLQIMAMGKLGGHELNFSSDIDLIFAYPNAGETQGVKKPIEHQQFFTKVAQKLIYALDHISEYGRCYRVDMRLRPMGESGPLVMPFAAIESYYQEQGRAWERYAMQKMRIVNINRHSQALYDLVKPFVYRKYVDFTTLDAIREMKVLIEKEIRRRQLAQNIKLGQGGIREVEFFIQALQLIHAGREPSCQKVSTLDALGALNSHAFIDNATFISLKEAYLYLREVEHYLQIFNDEQTQILPQDSIDQVRLAILTGHESYTQCIAEIDQYMDTINQHFRSVVADANQTQSNHLQPSETLSVFADLWNLDLDEQESSDLLEPKLMQSESAALHSYLQSFKQKLRTTSISERGMRSIDRLMPYILKELVSNVDTLNRNQTEGIFGILLTITTRITYIDLLLENPKVRERLNTLCRKSLWVAQEIAQHPMLLDELLHPIYLKADDLSLQQWRERCAQELNQYMLRVDPDDVEAVMDTLRQFKHAYQLRIAAADISGTIAINQVSDKLSLLAEVILVEVLAQAWRQITQKHGIPEGKNTTDKGLGVVAYGKFGGIELSYGSDLDIVCLFDAKLDGQTDNSGTRQSVSHQDFYVKLVQKMTHYCITKTYHGILYDIDLRLRPSGNSGLLITHISSFNDYQRNTAWTWEHQALVRSRMVIGTTAIIAAFNKVRKETLCSKRNPIKLEEDVSQMREKMRKHLDDSTASLIDIKQCFGGIVDIEFMVQFWVLKFASQHPQIASWSDNLRILDACAQAALVEKENAQTLQQHYLWLRHLAHRLQLSDRKLAEPSQKLEHTRKDVKLLYQALISN